LLWAALLVAAGMVLAVLLWAEPLRGELQRTRADYQAAQQTLAQTKAELGQTRGQLQTTQQELQACRAQAQTQAQWAAYGRARAEVLEAWRALKDGQKVAARTHLTLAQRALADLSQQAADPALQQALQELQALLQAHQEGLDEASPALAARRLADEVFPALDALEGLLPTP